MSDQSKPQDVPACPAAPQRAPSAPFQPNKANPPRKSYLEMGEEQMRRLLGRPCAGADEVMMPRRAPERPIMPPRAPSALNWRNKANLLTNAATGVTDALVREVVGTNASATSVAASRSPVPQGNPSHPDVPPHAPESANWRNKANLSHQQLAAVRMLLAGIKVSVIHQDLGIDRKTLYRWRQSLNFLAELRRQHDLLCREIRRVPSRRY
jgi:hypothetical protein